MGSSNGSSAVSKRMCLAARVSDVRGRAIRHSSVDAVVQPGAPASGIRLSKPSPISGAASNSGGLISGEHYRFSRVTLIKFMANPSRCRVGMEVCGARLSESHVPGAGHEVRFISLQFVKPHVKSSRNDFNDAEAICEAFLCPTTRLVTPKIAAHQDLQNMHRVRRCLIGAHTALLNQVRELLAEYGVVVPQQGSPLRRALLRLVDDLTTCRHGAPPRRHDTARYTQS